MCGSDIFLGIIAVLFPPFAVWVKRGICSADSLINIALCCLGFLPGLIHAWYIIASYPDPSEEYGQIPSNDPEAQPQAITYYFVQQGPSSNAQGGAQRGYGTISGGAPPNQQFPGQERGTANAFPPPAGQSNGQEEIPPSYEQTIQGNNKVQRP